VTRDEVADPQDLSMWLTVNGQKDAERLDPDDGLRRGASGQLPVSQFMTLHPGDVISTGTPPGVGLGMKPPRYLKAGDVVELGIEGLGSSART
jgi:2-keto-4-pentenoate hydratase/2-oxohepta-3-ene-1,7-dioic acid hydratase in catechol pathway